MDKRLIMLDFNILIEFAISVLLAFIVFTVQSMRTDTKSSLKGVQELKEDVAGIGSTVKSIDSRLDRLENQKDQEASNSRRNI